MGPKKWDRNTTEENTHLSMKNQGLGCAFPINALSIRWNASSKLLVLLVSVDTQNRAGPIRSNQKDSMYWMKRCSIICWAISRGSIALIQTSRNACIGKERLEKQHSFKEGAGDNILQVRPKQCQKEEEQAQLPFWWLFELLHFRDDCGNQRVWKRHFVLAK